MADFSVFLNCCQSARWVADFVTGDGARHRVSRRAVRASQFRLISRHRCLNQMRSGQAINRETFRRCALPRFRRIVLMRMAFSCAVASECFGTDVESAARTLSMVASSVYHSSDSMDLDRGREQR